MSLEKLTYPITVGKGAEASRSGGVRQARRDRDAAVRSVGQHAAQRERGGRTEESECHPSEAPGLFFRKA